MKTILLVEDEPSIAEVLKIVFSSEGYTVYRVQTAEEAQELCLTIIPDIIISDLKLEGMDGLAFLQIVRAHENLQLIPFVVISATGDPSLVGVAKEFGATAYLWRPFDDEELVEVVSRILIPHKKHRTSVSLWPLV
ncbi:MAG: response regulator [Ignavibacteriae bacterium]|nr:response regulator [Ignavibacteriota bacterium]